MQSEPHALGQRIAALRRAQGWSQRRLAEAAGVSHGYVALLELGRLPSPGKFRLDAIAHALDLRTSDALLGPLSPRDTDDEAGSQSETWQTWQLERRGPAPRTLEDRVRAAMAGESSHDASATSLATSRTPSIRQTGPVRPSSSEPGRAAAAPPPDRSGFESANVLGSLDYLRPSGVRPLPVFRWGSCGDPRDRESPPDPDHLEFPPPGHETLIGPNGFGVVVKGDSMAGRGIYDGDVVWVNPDRAYQIGKVVLALVSDESGASGMVVKTYARTEVGDCLLSESVDGRSPVVCQEFKVIGPVVGITSWRLPT